MSTTTRGAGDARTARAARTADGSSGPGRAREAQRTNRRRETRAALLFISPWILGFLVLTLWPVLYSGYLSLTDYDIFNAPNFVGLENYERLVTDDDARRAIGNTFYFAIIQVPLQVVVSLALALLLNQAGRSAGFFRTAFFLPRMTPPVAVGVLLLLLFNGQDGLINEVLGWFGIDGPNWTTDSAWVKPGLILMSLWAVGSSVIILLAALRNVPTELYDAARVDGANAWQKTIKITVPMISGPLFFIFIINSIDALQSFTEAYTAYFGAGNSTYSNEAAEFYSIYLFRQAFEFLNMGYASALAWVLFVIILLITLVQLRVSKRFVYYEGEQR